MAIVKLLFLVYIVICVCSSFLFTYVKGEATGTDDNYVCLYNVNHDISSRNQPLFLSKEGGEPTLYFPENIKDEGFVALKRGEELLVACPGHDNAILSLRKSEDSSICVKKNDLRSTSKKGSMKPSDMTCKKNISAEIKETGETCGSTKEAKIYEIGYDAYGWQKVITVCHNPKTMDTLYATHILKGKVIRAREKSVPRISKFEEGDLYDHTKIQIIYKKTNVLKVFEQILGTQYAHKYLDDRINFLAKGHLCPDADMVMASLKIATYYFANVAPQWQSINGKNWKHLEGLIRTASARLKDDIHIETGTFGELELFGADGYRKIYLGYPEKTIRVPKYLYKRLFHKPTNSGIVFVTSNDPFLKDTEKVTFCKNVCEETGWHVGEEPSAGYTFCCTVDSFRKVVKDAVELNVKEVFRYPENQNQNEGNSKKGEKNSPVHPNVVYERPSIFRKTWNYFKIGLSDLGKKFPEAAKKIIQEQREKNKAAKTPRSPRKQKQDASL